MEEEETKNHLYFSKQHRDIETNVSKMSYFMCQYDGSLTENTLKTTWKNKIGTIKTGQICPARMAVNQSKVDGKVSVKYIKTHNHEISEKDVVHHPTPKSEREEIKSKLALGIPSEKIFEDLREGFDSRYQRDETFQVKKKHLLSKRHIKNIERSLRINCYLHSDDATSTYHIVQQLRKEKYDSILFYKPQNQKIVVNPSHTPDDDLFLFGFMTQEQEEKLKKGANKIICVDATHETIQFKLKSITVLVPDENNHGYPVAHLISNREDENVMEMFFSSIKDEVGDISINALMTANDNTGRNAFRRVFGSHI